MTIFARAAFWGLLVLLPSAGRAEAPKVLGTMALHEYGKALLPSIVAWSEEVRYEWFAQIHFLNLSTDNEAANQTGEIPPLYIAVKSNAGKFVLIDSGIRNTSHRVSPLRDSGKIAGRCALLDQDHILILDLKRVDARKIKLDYYVLADKLPIQRRSVIENICKSSTASVASMFGGEANPVMSVDLTTDQETKFVEFL